MALSPRRPRLKCRLLAIGMLLATGDVAANRVIAAEVANVTFDPEAIAFFETSIRPILVARCQGCHGAIKQEGNLRLDSRSAMLTGGDSGPAVAPGKLDEGWLIDAVRYGDVYQMPPDEQLPTGEIAALEDWVRRGAPWPSTEQVEGAGRIELFDLQSRKRNHWAWRPINRPLMPTIESRGESASPIDALLLSRLQEAKLEPTRPAEKRALLRRATYALTGLPPSVDELALFESDSSPEAFANVVDRLLASPHFGERWARHWLDLVRYSETLGHEFDYALTDAWRYRDYVIRALNADLPYDQFVREHIAGDLIHPARVHPTEGYNESIIATAFWYMGEALHAPVDSKADYATRVENQVDVLSKTFLGLTVACARCHDHKFDAISTKDYYALCGYATSSHQQEAMLDPGGKIQDGVQRLEELQQHGREILSQEPTAPEVAEYVARSLLAGAAARSVDDQALRSEIARIKQRTSDASASSNDQVVFEDFNSDFKHWRATGWAFGDSPTVPGDWRSDFAKPKLLVAGQAHSGRLAAGLHGVLRSAKFTIEKPYVHYHLSGRNGKVRLVVDGYMMDKFTDLLFEGLSFTVDTDADMQWHTQSVAKHVGHRAHIELIDSGDGYIAVDEIRFASAAEPDKSAEGVAVSEDIWPIPQPSLVMLDQIAKEVETIDANLPAPIRVVAIADGSGEDERVHIRGNHKVPGDVSPRRFLGAIAGAQQPPHLNGSGRLELAERMLSPENPFIARVMVNRIWHHLFGRGIVATTDNFGVLGEPPSHPELLDYLAARFVEQGWSIKRLIREVMLSQAYQRASVGVPSAEEADPRNILLHRANIRRLEGEAIRDTLLAVSGQLDRTQFGPSVPIHLTRFMDGRGRPEQSGPLDGARRRSIYLEVRRNFLSPMLLAFDTPPPASTTGRRHVSNVPAQALTMLNDPFVSEQCRHWASQVIARTGELPEIRVERLYHEAFSRPPSAEESTEAVAFVVAQAKRHGVDLDDVQPWADLCHVLVNLKEFIYLQ